MKQMIFSKKFDKKYIKIFNFLDDWVLILPEKYVAQGLELFFDQCLQERFILNLRKCTFFQEKLKFLGFLISQKGIEAEESRIKGILDLPHPKTTKEAQRLMGYINFIARQFPRVQQYLSPLAKMMGKKKFQLSREISLGLGKIRDF